MKRDHLTTNGILTLVLLLAASGCGEPEAQFKPNLVQAKYQQVIESPDDLTVSEARQHLKDVGEILVAHFGTPDEPSVPVVEGVNVGEILNIDLLRRAAGPVGRDEQGRRRGLYREHCAHCHGVTGDGAGPTAIYLNPYPRDYRLGIFKFKRTATPARPPTDEDLHQVLELGVPGTAMPSFRLLPDDELEALVHYVRYLAIRGEFEKLLYSEIYRLEEGQRLLDLDDRVADPALFAEQLGIVNDALTMTVEKWIAAEQLVTEVPPPPADWGSAESVARGEVLFFGDGACVSCHGQTALGDGELGDYDDWTKPLITEVDQETVETYLDLGMLPPRPIRPRNLRMDVYRGGRRPIDVYWRVKNGIAGSPMPAAPTVLSEDDVWHIVAYVRQLPFESISQPGRHDPEYQRERQ